MLQPNEVQLFLPVLHRNQIKTNQTDTHIYSILTTAQVVNLSFEIDKTYIIFAFKYPFPKTNSLHVLFATYCREKKNYLLWLRERSVKRNPPLCSCATFRLLSVVLHGLTFQLFPTWSEDKLIWHLGWQAVCSPSGHPFRLIFQRKHVCSPPCEVPRSEQ